MVVLMAGCFQWVKRRNEPIRDVTLVIIGLDDAGKTTTIDCLKGEPPDGIVPTIGFNKASLTIGKWNITIYDLGGGNGVRSVWQNYYADVYGVIFAVDSGNHNRIVESKNVLNKIFEDPKVTGKPVVVFANKQDKAGALNEEQISEKLALQELSKQHNFKFNVISCSAIKGYGKKMDKRIHTGLEWLLGAISQDYSTINEKVTKESAIQREQEAKERKERKERMIKLREEREKAAKEAGVEEEEESDDDVVTNPFRNINDQIVITEKNEKKAKEKLKKIKKHQMMEKEEDQSDEEVVEPTKVKKKKKKGNAAAELEDDDDGDNNQRTKTKKKKNVKKKQISFEDNEHFQESDSDELPIKTKNKKKITQKDDSISDIENIESPVDENSSKKISPKKKTKKNKNKTESECIDALSEEEISPKKKGKKNKNKKRDSEEGVDEEDRTINTNTQYIDNLKTTVIQVSSKESVREDSPQKSIKKKKKVKKKNELDDNISEYELGASLNVTKTKKKKKNQSKGYINEDFDSDDSGANVSTEKTINDSRAELFLARSTDSLNRDEDPSICCNNKQKKDKKKKQTIESNEVEEFDDGLDTKIDKKKKKKKKKANKTDIIACTSSVSEPGVLDNSTRSLPPLRAGSKLEPIKLKGKLPTWNNKEDSSLPSWALAKPNFDDDNIMT